MSSDLDKLRIDRDRSRTRSARAPSVLGRFVPWLFPLALLAGGVLFWPRISSVIDTLRLPEVAVVQAIKMTISSASALPGKAANGYVVAARRAALSADTPGRIVEINVTEGTVVRQGDLVARLYAEEYEAALKSAEAQVLVAEATETQARADLRASTSEKERMIRSLEAARSDAEQAQASERLSVQELERIEVLLPKGIATRQELDRARKDENESAAALRSARARVLAAEAAVTAAEQREQVSNAQIEVARAQVQAQRAIRDQAKATLDKTEVRAPFDGVVVLKDAEVGEVVSPNSQGGSNARGSVCTMVDFDSLEVQADVPETSLSAVSPGAAARIFLDAFPNRAYPGRVSRIWPTANRQKATIEVRIRFDEPDDRLRPEMGVRVVFLDEETEAALASAPEETEAELVIPNQALVNREQGQGVFVVVADRVEFRLVTPGELRGNSLAIEAGLSPGESIVLQPPPSLDTGDRVRIRDDN